MLGLDVRHSIWVCEFAEAVGGGDEELCGRAAVEGPLEEAEVPAAVPRRPRLEREDRPPTGKTADLQILERQESNHMFQSISRFLE